MLTFLIIMLPMRLFSFINFASYPTKIFAFYHITLAIGTQQWHIVRYFSHFLQSYFSYILQKFVLNFVLGNNRYTLYSNDEKSHANFLFLTNLFTLSDWHHESSSLKSEIIHNYYMPNNFNFQLRFGQVVRNVVLK